LEPPEPGSDNPAFYIIRVKFGNSEGNMTCYYVYEWQQ
jgi:hypothetical protein